MFSPLAQVSGLFFCLYSCYELGCIFNKANPMTWQTVATQLDQPSGLGESPFWHPDEQMLYWIDIPGKLIHRLNVFMGTTQSWAMPSEPGSMAPARDGQGNASGLVVALRDGIYRAREWGGPLQLLAKATYNTATTRFNDGKADPCGRFWAGTMYEPRDVASAQLFSLDCRNGQAPVLALKADHATIANGLAWSPGKDTVYWSDTTSHTIRAWDWDPETSAMTTERIFKQWAGKPDGWQAGQPGMPAYGGRPDGAAVDVQGNYYAAMFEGGRVLKLSPAGEVLQDIAVPALCPTMPCFGGDDLKTLYLTTARHNRSAAELHTWPGSGCVFSMQVDVPGLPVNFFLD
jgi:sugar lactone lactonase YvrE